MGYRTVEQVLEDLKDTLQAHFPDALDAITAAHTVSVSLPIPDTRNYFIANNVDTVPELSNLPAVILMGWNEVITQEGEQDWDIWDFDVAVRMWTSGYDQEKLTRAIYRYAAAVACIVRTRFLALTTVSAISDLRVDYSSVSPTEPLLQALEVSFRVRACRDYIF